MAIKIELINNIDNDSLQIGDVAYYALSPTMLNGISVGSGDPQEVGVVSDIDGNSITINSVVNQPSDSDFIMFSKNTMVNNTSLLGYYAEVELKNNSESRAELFSLSSEITPSSK